ncbi:MAG: DUF4136 domain-containing protein [Tannerellaceae bacterium]|jgi:hypothetical protein|nr:DUF4136 domain-containing protein [Tannerellaceae bacterium]
MKQSIPYTLVALIICTVCTKAQSPTVCRLGFDYEISKSPAWGKGWPVVTEIYPGSPAAGAGLKLYDIVREIDGRPAGNISGAEIDSLLNPPGKDHVALSVEGPASGIRLVAVAKDCKPSDAITEDRLATAFAMYSLETTGERTFVCPFVTGTPGDAVDFTSFKTYAFPPADENNRRLEEALNACIGKNLDSKGLKLDSIAPDIIVETFYFYKKNPNYKPSTPSAVAQATANAATPAYRYDMAKGSVEKYPFLDPSTPETNAEYLLQLGIRMIDKRIESRNRVVWECEANEMMSAAFRLENYAQTHIPLMLMQYPYVRYNRNPRFLLSRKTYNYTGLSYDFNNLGRILGVEPGSPADKAGITVGDVIERIDNLTMEYSAEEYTAAYKQFITATLQYRDKSTIFADANGFGYCMYWDKFKYAQIAAAIKTQRNRAVFAYLFKYAPYVNPSGANLCRFNIQRQGEKLTVMVYPEVRAETTILVK